MKFVARFLIVIMLLVIFSPLTSNDAQASEHTPSTMTTFSNKVPWELGLHELPNPTVRITKAGETRRENTFLGSCQNVFMNRTWVSFETCSKRLLL